MTQTPSRGVALFIDRTRSDAELKPRPETEGEALARRLGILRELAEMGMDLARGLAGAVAAEPGNKQHANSFCQMVESVRQTVALEVKLLDDHHRRSAPLTSIAIERHRRLMLRFEAAAGSKPAESKPAVENPGPAPETELDALPRGTGTVHQKA